jgi:hypothetical protein
MKYATVLLGLLMVVNSQAQRTDAWYRGWDATHQQALDFNSWEQMYDWADACSQVPLRPRPFRKSTDLVGERHSYVDTVEAGKRDACIAIKDEMRFIGRHNSGGTAQFLELMRDYLRNNLHNEGIIAPGHF